MKKLQLGMKIYSYDWFWKYGLDYAEAAQLLKGQGVDFVICQNEYIPSMNTAAKAEVPAEHKARFATYDDRRFRMALKEADIGYWASALMFFHPAETEKYEAIPVDIHGRRCQKEDWYLGACPGNDAYAAHRLSQITAAVDALEPDGVFLGFMRFPGFWETWLPGTRREDWNDCCYCDDCIGKFKSWSGLSLPDAQEQRGAWIRENCYSLYTEWKAWRLREIILALREQGGNRVKVMLNTVPFDEKRFGSARAELFGQNIELLRDVVDVFEVMAYHQILGLPGDWVAEAAADVRRRVTPENTVLCTVQGKPDYLTGMHAGKGRRTDVPPEELAKILRRLKREGQVDGVVVYSWADFLEQQFEQGLTQAIDAIKSCL